MCTSCEADGVDPSTPGDGDSSDASVVLDDEDDPATPCGVLDPAHASNIQPMLI